MRLIVLLPVAMVTVLVAAFTASATMTKSKISLHAGGYSQATQQIVENGKPRIIKLLDDFSPAAAIKKASPGIFIIGRIYLPSQPNNGDPEAAANKWWAQHQSTIMSYRHQVDAWEGYNEPGVGNLQMMQWLTKFEVTRVQILASHGLRAVIGSFATGTPNIDDAAVMNAFNPAIEAAMKARGIMGVHEYSSPYLWGCYSNASQSGWFTGRYRKWYNQILIPKNLTIPLAITENGIDAIPPCTKGDPAFAGWRLACSWWSSQGHPNCEQFYVDQLRWYDSILRENAYVLGATVFQIDCSGWTDYDVAPAAQQLTQYLVSQQ